MDICTGCFRQKLLCQMSGVGGQNNAAEEKDAKQPDESNVSNEDSDGSWKWWMLKFITMKVGPPKGAKPTMG